MFRHFIAIILLVACASAQSVTFQGTVTVQGNVSIQIVPSAPVPDSTLAIETANNTSACSGIGLPDAGCNGAFAGLSTDAGNTNAQTQVPQPAPHHISPLPLLSLMYPGATSKMVCEYQPWFYNVSPFNGHPNIGMNENSAAAVTQQLLFLKRIGCDAISIDYYGTDAAQSFNLATTVQVAAVIASNPAIYPKMMLMLDKGAINNSDNSNGDQCTTNTSVWSSSVGYFKGAGVTFAGIGYIALSANTNKQPNTNPTIWQPLNTCIANAINTQLDYANSHWLQQSWYMHDPASGLPLIEYFIIKTAWTGANFGTIYPAVKAHTNTYGSGAGIKIVDEFGAFGESGTDGQYGWIQPPIYVDSSPTTQFCIFQPACTAYDYFNDFYAQANANPSQVAIGLIYKGFDWSNASYNGGVQKILAEECGQTWLQSAGKAALNGFSSSKQMAIMHVATVNDYGEGHGIEVGIDDCNRVNTPTVVGSVASWTLAQTDATYASTSTIDHYKIWYGSGAGDLFLAQDNIPASATSFDLATANKPPPTGTWSIYVEEIPKALIWTEINGGGNGNGAPGTYTH